MRSAPQQLRELRCSQQHVLEIVEDEQYLPIPQVAAEPLGDRPLAGDPQIQSVGDGDQDVSRIAQRRERHERHPIRECPAQP